jgi:hypothetical protein
MCVSLFRQPYFVDQIEQQCLKVEGLFAWEAVPTSSDLIWSQVRCQCRFQVTVPVPP